MRATSSQRGYGSRWQKARATYLDSHPVCVLCEAAGRIEPSTVVDHIVPHKGDMELFWDDENWQPLCARCHNSKTVREDGAFGRALTDKPMPGCDADGVPIDPRHPWRDWR